MARKDRMVLLLNIQLFGCNLYIETDDEDLRNRANSYLECLWQEKSTIHEDSYYKEKAKKKIEEMISYPTILRL